MRGGEYVAQILFSSVNNGPEGVTHSITRNDAKLSPSYLAGTCTVQYLTYEKKWEVSSY